MSGASLALRQASSIGQGVGSMNGEVSAQNPGYTTAVTAVVTLIKQINGLDLYWIGLYNICWMFRLI